MSARNATAPKPRAPWGAVGALLALARGLAGLTRAQLAARAQINAGVIAQIERGERPASPALTATAARALRIDPDALLARPYRSVTSGPGADHAGIPALRRALDHADDAQPPGATLTAIELRARLDDCTRDRAAARYAQITVALPELLAHAHALAADARLGAGAEPAQCLLTDACLLAHTVAYRFGYLDLAALCHEHARHAATHSGDPLRPAVVTCEHALLRLHRGDYPGVRRALARAHAAITDQAGPAADAVRVQLHLRQALACARSGHVERADEHIDTAHDLIAAGIPAHPYPTVTATATNTDIHWVAIAVELDDAATALARAEQVKIPTGEQPARIARYWIDLARAQALHGDHTQALDTLTQARAIAPQLVRHHPQAHETVAFLAETEARAPDSLAGFARWISPHA